MNKTDNSKQWYWLKLTLILIAITTMIVLIISLILVIDFYQRIGEALDFGEKISDLPIYNIQQSVEDCGHQPKGTEYFFKNCLREVLN